MTRPLIGITCYVEPASWGVWTHVRAALLPHRYVEHVVRAGGRPLLLPPLSATEGAEEDADVLDALDGLIVSGGVDVDPARYGQVAHPSVQSPRPDRDAAEVGLVRAAVERDLPLLGICRGMQVMAVAGGGELLQHLPDEVGTDLHSPERAAYGRHRVRIEAGTRLHEIVGDALDVATYHHQGVRTHPGYSSTAYAEEDSLLEAMEDADAAFRLAVQWHPEVDSDNRLFQALVASARP